MSNWPTESNPGIGMTVDMAIAELMHTPPDERLALAEAIGTRIGWRLERTCSGIKPDSLDVRLLLEHEPSKRFIAVDYDWRQGRGVDSDLWIREVRLVWLKKPTYKEIGDPWTWAWQLHIKEQP